MSEPKENTDSNSSLREPLLSMLIEIKREIEELKNTVASPVERSPSIPTKYADPVWPHGLKS